MRKYVLDLSEIYADHRRKAYLGHRPTWTTIRTLIQTVREIFAISSRVHVCSAEQIFYPDSESVEILRDGETLKILLDSASIEPTIIPDSEEEIAKEKETSNHQDSTFEDIESVLCSLPKPKRRRVRKRKAKKVAQDDQTPHCPASEAAMEECSRKEQEKNTNSSDSERKGKPAARKLSSSEVDERPYRNLNRRLKARVVRAVSLSTLGTPTPEEALMSPPSELNGSAASEGVHSTRSCKKARVVRALSLENTAEVKRELIEACRNGNPTWPLEMAREITTQMGLGQNAEMIVTDEHEASLTNDLETYSTIVSDV